TYKPAFGLVEQRLTLKQKPPISKTVRQIERPKREETFDQGHDGAPTDETVKVSDLGKVDLLVVIDNSDSMDGEQTNLKTKLPALTKHLQKTDWRIAVVTTDSSCLRGGRVINKGDADAEKAFETAVGAGIGGDGT